MDTDRIAPKPPVSVRPGGIGHLDRGAIQILMLTLIAVVLVVAALDLASAIVVPSVMAVLAAIALAPLARQVEKLRVPASVAAAVIVAGLVFSSVAMIYALLPSAEAWNARAPQVIREIELRVRHINVSFLDSIGATAKDVPEQSVTDGTTNPADVAPKPEEEKPVEVKKVAAAIPLQTDQPVQEPEKQASKPAFLTQTKVQNQVKNTPAIKGNLVMGSAKIPPAINSGLLTKNLALIAISSFIFILTMDLILVKRKRIARAVGHNIDHILFFVLMILLISIFTRGVII